MDSVYGIVKVYFKIHSLLLFQIWKKSVLNPASPGITLKSCSYLDRSPLFLLSRMFNDIL